jgi:regulator of cell morphogenesis and NO signaling
MLNQETQFETVTQHLAQDHRRLDKIIDDLCAMVEDGELDRAEYSFKDLDGGLRRHIRLEEELLFPVFDVRTGLCGPTQIMRYEHRHIEQLLVELSQALAEGRRRAASSALTTLLQVLGNHNIKEERILYPKTDQALSDEERRALIARLRAS